MDQNQLQAGLSQRGNVIDASLPSVVKGFERRIAELENVKILLAEKHKTVMKPTGGFEQLFELAFNLLASPIKIWHSGVFEHQKLVLRLTFPNHLAYRPNEGFRTPKTTLPFSVLRGVGGLFERMAETETYILSSLSASS